MFIACYIGKIVPFARDYKLLKLFTALSTLTSPKRSGDSIQLENGDKLSILADP
jgi:hypothetical protein